uniref:Protein AKTIP homolog n=1 Tax=Schistocephalus solidus TaxID=70667 RepID=A0A0X3P5C5_SCHSO
MNEVARWPSVTQTITKTLLIVRAKSHLLRITEPCPINPVALLSSRTENKLHYRGCFRGEIFRDAKFKRENSAGIEPFADGNNTVKTVFQVKQRHNIHTRWVVCHY